MVSARSGSSRELILAAFRELVLAVPFDQLTVQQIIERAGVVRSTFYDQFRDKRSLLIVSVSPLLEVLARCAVGTGSSKEVKELVEHFWHNRSIARIVFGSQAGKHITSRLSEMMIELGATSRVRSTALACGYIGMLRLWVSGELQASEEQVVAYLLESAVKR